MSLRREPIKRTVPRNSRAAGALAVPGWAAGPRRPRGAGAGAGGPQAEPGPHHPLQGAGGLRGLVQELTVLQLLAEPLQRVQGLVQLHRHGHLGQVLPDVISQDVPQADAAAVGAGRRQAGPSSGLGLPTALQDRPWKGKKPGRLSASFHFILLFL